MAAGRSGSVGAWARAGSAAPITRRTANKMALTMTSSPDIARPENIAALSYHDLIRAAHSRIAGHVRRTPVIEVDAGALGLALDRPLALKLEFLQHTGSFKPRGAFNNLLSRAAPQAGVAAASGGNHGVAVASAAAQLRSKARIFVSGVASQVTIARVRPSAPEVAHG